MLRFYPALGCAITIWIGVSGTALAVQPTAEEQTASHHWIQAHWESETNVPPFSFEYGGQGSAELLKSWPAQRATKVLDPARTQHTLTYKDPQTALEVRCEVIEYADYPAVEWILFFQNKGDHDTPVLKNIQALDLSLTRAAAGEFVVHHANGSDAKADDFAPLTDTLPPKAKLKFGSTYALSSGVALPFFNLQAGSEGTIVGVGWSGSWMAEFTRDDGPGLKVQVGMYSSHTSSTHLRLHPGEQIRTPRMLLLFWKQDRIHGHNLWRRLLLDHYVLRRGGQVLKAPLCDVNWGMMTAEQQIAKINWWGDHQLPMDCYWIDAGWSGRPGLKLEEWGIGAANRIPRSDLYPEGMRPIAEAAHRRGMKFLLWVWPHTVLPGVEVAAEHPDWVVPGNGLDHGNPEVNQWMIQRYSKMIGDFGLDVFRQDGHPIFPADAGPDRQGINQVRYFEGFYQFWDALLREHPNLIIDNCAAGGRKIDIETTQRSISLWRSDYQVDVNFDPAGMQGQTYGLSFWVPLSGGTTAKPNPYSIRSGYSPALMVEWHCWDAQIKSDGFDFDLVRKLLNEYLAIRSYFYGDYYPLTAYSEKQDVWMAWQFHRPDLEEGMVQAFRRKLSAYEDAWFRLGGLDLQADYILTETDPNQQRWISGRELSEKGLRVHLPKREAAVLFTYNKVK